MEKLTNEGVVESGLPLLDEGHFKTAIVNSLCVYWDGGPDIQVVLVLPVGGVPALLELVVRWRVGDTCVSDCTICREYDCMAEPDVEFGLHIPNVGETNVDALRLEKKS